MTEAGEGKYNEFDGVIVGSGPSAMAAALVLLRQQLSVVVIETRTFPRHRPGESLHPGIEPLLAHLDATGVLSEANFERFDGIYSGANEPLEFTPFGQDESGVWQGYQAIGSEFDSALQRRVLALGGQLVNSKALEVLQTDGRVVGVKTLDGAKWYGRFVFDGSGGKHWLAKQLSLSINCYSPKLLVKYGYIDTSRIDDTQLNQPLLKTHDDGWYWLAKIRHHIYSWASLNWHDGQAKATSVESDLLKQLGDCPFCDGPRFADVTWRRVDQSAGQGYFLLGDAAMVLDPASSQGVMRAMLSGTMAAELALKIKSDPEQEALIIGNYQQGMALRFEQSRRALASIYRAMPQPPAWLALEHYGQYLI